MASSVKITSYLANLAKSAGYIGVDVFKSYAPTMSSVINETKDLSSELYQKIQDFTSNGSEFSIQNIYSKSKNIAANTWNNAIDDIKTGRIYNKERNSAIQDEMFTAQMGEDFSFDFDFDDEDWGDDEEGEVSNDAKIQTEAQVESTKAIIAEVDAVGRGLSASMTTATIESANYIAGSAREDNLALYGLNKEGFGTISKALMSINENIVNFAKLGEPLTAHMQNSLLFFTETKDSLRNIENTLKEISENTKPAEVAGSKGYKRKRSLGSLMSDDGGIDFLEIKDTIKQNIKENADMFSDIKDMILPIIESEGKNISILGTAVTSLTKAFIPRLMEQSIKSLDKSINNFLGAGLTKIVKDRAGDGTILGYLGDLLDTPRDQNRSVSLSDYEKGAVQWDGIARKALTDVIPTTLLQIYSVLSGTDPMRFDYNSGKYIKTTEITKLYVEDKKKYHVEQAGGQFYKDLQNRIIARYKDKDKQEKMLGELYKYFEASFDNSSEFDIEKESNGIDPETYAFIKRYTRLIKEKGKNGDKRVKDLNAWVKRSNLEAENLGNFFRSEQASGSSIMQSKHDELTEGVSAKVGNRATIIGLDEYGHNYYYYLQGIWQYTYYMANNFKSIGGVGVGAPQLNQKVADLKAKDLPKIDKVTFAPNSTTVINEINKLKGSNTLLALDSEEYKEAVAKQQKQEAISQAANKVSESTGSFLKDAVEKVYDFFGKDPDTLNPVFAFTVRAMDKLSYALDTMLFDKDSGALEIISNKIVDIFKTIKNKLKDKVWNPVKNFFKSIGERLGETSFGEATKEKLGDIGEAIWGTTRKIFYGERTPINNGPAAYGRKVTKSGVVTVSEGELIIPSEYNPFYHGINDKSVQLAREKRLGRGLPTFAEGGTVGEEVNDEFYKKTDKWFNKSFKEKDKNRKKSKSWLEEMTGGKDELKKTSFGDKVRSAGDYSIFGIVRDAIRDAVSPLRKKVEEITDEKQIEEDKKETTSRIDRILEDVGAAKGYMGAGAIIGAGASLFTGGIIGPIAGAAIGAGVGFLSQSKELQDFLFGPEEDGERKRQKAYDFIMKQVPAVGKGAAIGVVAGTLMGSPILGAFLGGATGFVASNEKMQDFLFGEKDEKGDRKGGVLANKIFDHIDITFHNIDNRLRVWLKDLGRGIKEKAIGIFEFIKKQFEDPTTFFAKLLGGVVGLTGKAIRLPVKLTDMVTGGISNKINAGNLKRGYSTYNKAWGRNMTAQERILARTKLNPNQRIAAREFNNFDTFLASIKDYDQLNYYKDLIEAIKVERTGSPEQEAAIKTLLDDENFKKYMGRNEKFITKNINKMSGLITDESKRKGLDKESLVEAREEQKLSILDKIRIMVEGIATDKDPEDIAKEVKAKKANKRKDYADDENHKTVFDALGNPHIYTRDKQGNWEEVKNDENTNASRTKINGLLASITSLPNRFSDSMKSLFGSDEEDEKEKKETWLDKLLSFGSGLVDKAKGFLEDKFGDLGIIGEGLSSGIAGVISAVTGLLTAAGLSAVLVNLFTDSSESGIVATFVNKIGSAFGLGGNNDKSEGSTNTFFNSSSEFQTSGGGRLTQGTDANGNIVYYDSNGNISNDMHSVRAGEDTLTTRFKKNEIRQFLKGPGSPSFLKLAGRNLRNKAGELGESVGTLKDAFKFNKLKSSVKMSDFDDLMKMSDDAASIGTKSVAKVVTGEVEDTGRLITTTTASIDDVAIAAAKSNIDDGLTAIGKILTKIKLPLVGTKLAGVVESFPKIATKAASSLKSGVKSAAEFLGKAAPVITVVLFVSDFMTGWEDARSTLQITKTPTTPQRALCGILRALKNLIPLLGPLIPDKWLINLLAKHVGPAFGIDPSALIQDQEEAEAEVAAYNEKYGTNYDVTEYNKSVLHDYTFTERIGNAFRTTKQEFSDNWKSIKGAFEEGGGLKGFSAAVKTAFNKGLPGILGELYKAKQDITKYAFKGDIEGIWSIELSDFSGGGETNEDGIETAVPSIFSRLVGQIPLVVNKLGFTPVALVSKLFHAIKDRILDPQIIIGDIKGFAGGKVDEVFGITNAIEAIHTGDVYKLLSYNSMDENDNGIIKGLKTIGSLPVKFGSIIPTIVSAAGLTVWNKVISPIVNKVKETGSNFKNGFLDAFYAAYNGEWGLTDVTQATDNEGNPLSGFQKVVLGAGRLAGGVFSLFAKAGEAIIGKAKEIFNKVATKVGTFNMTSAQIIVDALTGEPGEMWKQEVVQKDPENPVGEWMDYLMIGEKLMLTPVSAITWVGRKISEKFEQLKAPINTSIIKIGENQLKLNQYMNSGDLKGLWSTPTDFEDSPLSGVATGVSIGVKLVNTLPTIVNWVGGGLKTAFGAFTDKIKGDVEKTKTYYDTLMKAADNGDVTSIVNASLVPASPFGGIFTFASSVLRIAAIFKAGTNWIGKKIKDAAADAKDALTGSWLGKLFGWDESPNTNTKASTSGGASGMMVPKKGEGINGFQSQLDPRYKDISFAGSNIGNNGCGPAVAAMASASMGGNLSMNSAINKAKSYTNNQGTSVDYFRDVLHAVPIKGNAVKTSLENGKPVILLGRDPSNTSKDKSPFGPNNHYVLATGMRNGKILINDPEATGPRVYDQSILSKSNYSMTYGGSSRRGRFSNTSTAKQIWAYLTKKLGFTEAAAAGLMGCWQQESSLNPNTIEGYYLDGYPGDGAVHTTKGLNDFTTNVLFPAYAASGISIDKAAYMVDGNYYPGFGLAQWTGPRGKALHDYEKTSGKAWYTLSNQMQFIGHELKNSYGSYYNTAKSDKDVNEATTHAYKMFEGGTRSDWLEARKQQAAEIYKAFTGKNYDWTGGGDDASSSSSGESSTSSTNGGLLSVLTSIFGSLSNIFDIKNGFSLGGANGESGTNTTASSSGKMGAAAAAAAAENQLEYHEQGDNITSFGEWSGCNGQPWCGAFSAWSIAQAFDGSNSSAVKALYGCPNVNYVPTLVDTFKSNKAWYKTPRVGDEVIYGDETGPYHVGIVTEVDNKNKTYVSVEGNSNDKVSKKMHSSFMDGSVIGYGRPNYSGATGQVKASNNSSNVNAIDANDYSYKATGSGLRGGSSGILLRSAPSRFAYGKLRGQVLKYGGASKLNTKARFNNIDSDLKTKITTTLSNFRSNLSRASYSGGNGIDPELVTNLLVSITSLLDSIASNTAPTERIYSALVEYIDYVKGQNNTTRRAQDKVDMPTSNDDIDSNLAGLVSTLAAIARG